MRASWLIIVLKMALYGIEGLDVTTTTARGPTAAEILGLLASIERHGSNSPAAAAFRSALRRKGIEGP